ncbi:MAG: hypothetical protein AAF512_19735 [Pseudomonadota bacterium]
MNTKTSLDDQINKAAFWSAIIFIVFVLPSLFLPLDAPDGLTADRVAWLSANIHLFIVGWIIQMVLMLTLSAVFAGAAWQVAKPYPLTAIVASVIVLLSIVAFIIPKFIAIWSIPLMVEAISGGESSSVLAGQLIQLLHISLPFSLFTSFDYLGFWLYAIFCLMLARPLYGPSLSAKLTAFCFGAYGVLFHLMLVGVLAGAVAPAEIGAYSSLIGMLLLVAVISLVFYFKEAMPAAR